MIQQHVDLVLAACLSHAKQCGQCRGTVALNLPLLELKSGLVTDLAWSWLKTAVVYGMLPMSLMFWHLIISLSTYAIRAISHGCLCAISIAKIAANVPWVPCWNRIFQRLGSCWIQGFRQQSFKLPGGVECQWLQIYIKPLSPRKFQIKLNSVYIYI